MDEWKDGDAKWGSSKVRRFRLDPATASRPSTVRTTVRFLSDSSSRCCTSVLYGQAVPHQRPAPGCACTCTLGHSSIQPETPVTEPGLCFFFPLKRSIQSRVSRPGPFQSNTLPARVTPGGAAMAALAAILDSTVWAGGLNLSTLALQRTYQTCR